MLRQKAEREEFTECNRLMFKSYTYIRLSIDDEKAILLLNRPNARNALNAEMIEELQRAVQSLYNHPKIKWIELLGSGKHFSAGADLKWMQNAKNLDYDENMRESRKLYQLFKLWKDLPLVTVTYVKGACIGGANGLAAGSDILIAHPEAWFSFPETSLGLVPATISPFVLKRLSLASAKQWLLLPGKKSAVEALNKSWVDKIMNEDSYADFKTQFRQRILAVSHQSLQKTKDMLNRLDEESIKDKETYTAQLIAETRTSKTGQERMKNFFKTEDHDN